jgi:hypothetical protein
MGEELAAEGRGAGVVRKDRRWREEGMSKGKEGEELMRGRKGEKPDQG